MLKTRYMFFVAIALVFSACGGAKEQNQSAAKQTEEDMTTSSAEQIVLTSTAFKEGDKIPKKYTCDGSDVSPALNWSSVPAQAKSLAIIADDPDAPMGTWVHWVIFNIPPTLTGLPEDVPAKDSLPDGTLQGKNDFRNYGYGGPCPPGGTHRYFFKLYALDTMLKLPAGSKKSDVVKAMQGHILAQGELMGKYSR